MSATIAWLGEENGIVAAGLFKLQAANEATRISTLLRAPGATGPVSRREASTEAATYLAFLDKSV